jgi:hypothetical protein
MIPRYQRILFWTLGCAILLMNLVLLRGCEQAREKLTRRRDATPLAAPIATPSEGVNFALASDADATITLAERQVALPVEPTARARALLARLIAEYTFKNSLHPLESGPAIDDVFLLDLPLRPPAAPADSTYFPSPAAPDAIPHSPGGQLAVVNLHGTFADHHPSGIEVEMLTIQSIVGTLHANFPQIEQVQFLVDGQARETLNGHADLTRPLPAIDTSTHPATPDGP